VEYYENTPITPFYLLISQVALRMRCRKEAHGLTWLMGFLASAHPTRKFKLSVIVLFEPHLLFKIYTVHVIHRIRH